MGGDHNLSTKGEGNEDLPFLKMGSDGVGRWRENRRVQMAWGELLAVKGRVREGGADGGHPGLYDSFANFRP